VKPAHIAAAVPVAAVRGFNFVVIRWGLNDVLPLTLTVLRFVLASFPAVLIA
jgi:O-acetylserine/cysteine efflux transporter